MNRSLTSALLAITLSLGCGGVAGAQAPKLKAEQARTVDAHKEAFTACSRKDTNQSLVS